MEEAKRKEDEPLSKNVQVTFDIITEGDPASN